MHIDCTTCRAPADACGDCIVPVLLGAAPPTWRAHLDGDEQRALDVLADAGLVRPLRLLAEDDPWAGEPVARSVDVPIDLTVYVPMGVPRRRAG